MSKGTLLRELSRLPLVVAPMAGGPSTPDLVIAAAGAGAIGFLAGGYKSRGDLQAEMTAVRAATDAAFGVNLFVPGGPTRQPTALAAYVAGLERDAAALGFPVGAPLWDDDGYAGKLDLLLADPPPLVSFTFGCPTPDEVHALQAAGAVVAVTVTTLPEAAEAERAGVDCLALQGSEAGAHRGSFANQGGAGDDDRPLGALLAEVGGHTDLPLIGAGGIAGPADVAAARAAGATHVQVGTAFLRCTESGAHPVYKAALADPRFTTTALTRAFSGRRARSLVNGFLREHEDAPAAYPEINNATRPLRAAAAAAGDPEHMSLYAGVRFRQAEERAAGEIIEHLAAGMGRPVSP